MRLPAYPLLLILVLKIAVLAASAQNATGYLNDVGGTAYGINIPVENGFINVSNGNLHLEFPLATHPQRGSLVLNEKLVYDSRIWMFSPFGTHGSYHWWPSNVDPAGGTDTSAGWRFVNGLAVGSVWNGFISEVNETTCGSTNDGGIGGDLYETLTQYSIVWTDPSGTNHTFSSYYTVDDNQCDSSQGYASIAGGYATDGSGFYVSDDGTGNPLIRDNNGNVVYPYVADRYGNYLSADSSGNVVDDTGRTPVIVTTSGNTTYYDVLAPNGPINNNGTRVRYTVTTAAVPVQTNFQQSDTYDWTPTGGTLSPIQSIQLPDQSQYTFGYDSYGELASITLPTGGTIHYGYSNFFDSSNTANRWLTSRTVGTNPAMTLTPIVGTSCTNYSSGCVEYTTLHKPSGDETVYELTLVNGSWNTLIATYTGAVPVFTGRFPHGTPAANLIGLVTNTYQYSNACNASVCSGANYLTSSLATTLLANGNPTQTAQSYSTFDSVSGKPTLVQEWDYSSSNISSTTPPSSTPTRETDYTYTGYDPYQVTVKDNTGTVVGQTTYAYTNSATPKFGLPNHSALGGPYLSSISHWINSTNTQSKTQFAMDDSGMVTGIIDPNTNPQITFTYQCSNSLPLQVNKQLTSTTYLTTQYGYDCASGAIKTVQDPNDLAASRYGTQYAYEGTAGRLQSETRADGGTTSYTYPSTTEADSTMTASPNPSITSKTIVDTFGRQISSIRGGIETDISYDANGRTYCTSNPYVSSPAGATCVTAYDGLDRPLSELLQDGTSTRTWSYYGNTVTSTDEKGAVWTKTTDAFGRLTNVSEPGPSGTLQTNYTYDGLGNVASISQLGNASNGDVARTRTFTYDSLSRLVCESAPENASPTTGSQAICPTRATTANPTGVTGYTYYLAGNVQSKTDPRLVTTSFGYDTLNRLTSKTYQNDQWGTPPSTYYYDGNVKAGTAVYTLTNALGRLSMMTSGSNTGYQYAYDAVGRMFFEPSFIHDGSYGTAAWRYYDQAGNPWMVGYPDSRAVTQTFDGAGRLSSVTLANPQSAAAITPIVQSINYYPDGRASSVVLGNGAIQQTSTETSDNRLNLLGQSIASPFSSTTPFLSHTYTYGGTCAPGDSFNVGNICSITDALNGAHTQTFQYDSLNRLTSYARNAGGGQQYTIDAFGNNSFPVAFSNGSYTPTFNSANQVNNDPVLSALPPGTTSIYDPSGNLQYDVNQDQAPIQYIWDAENRLQQWGPYSNPYNNASSFLSYDYGADGLRARTNNHVNNSETEYLQFDGTTVSEYNSISGWTDYVYANGNKVARLPQAENVLTISGYNYGTLDYNYYPVVGNGGLGNYAVGSGDKLYVRQRQHGAAIGGVHFDTAGGSGTGLGSDQDGQGSADDHTPAEVWHQRVFDLSPQAGSTLQQLYFAAPQGSGTGAWSIDFADMMLYSAATNTWIQVLTQTHPVSLGYLFSGSFGGGYTTNSNWTIAPITQTPGVTEHYYLADHLGTAQMEISTGGWPTWTGEFAPFGQELDSQSSVSPYKFTGVERDLISGLDHAAYRQYSSVLGRWMSTDPDDGSMDASNPQTLNRYAYVGNMPMAFTDPSGLDGGAALGPCVAVAVGGANVAGDVACGLILAADAILGDKIAGLFFHPKLTASTSPRPAWDEHGSYIPQPFTSAASLLGIQGGCEFGPCSFLSGQASDQNPYPALVPSAAWLWSLTQTTNVSFFPWSYGNWCGPGGAGRPYNGTDALCLVHDYCYSQVGADNSAMTDKNVFNALSPAKKDGLRQCNQQLCWSVEAHPIPHRGGKMPPSDAEAAQNQMLDWFRHLVPAGARCKTR